jgi:hypothetical protein
MAFVVRPKIQDRGVENLLAIHLSDEPRDAVASCAALQQRQRVVSLTAASRGTEQVADDADTLEPLVGVPPATEALRELRRAWVRLASGSRDDPAGALAPLSVSATVRVEGWRGMLQRIRAAIDAEVAPMVGSVLLRHAL